MIRRPLPLLLPLALLLGGCMDRDLPTAPAAPAAPGLIISDAPRGGLADLVIRKLVLDLPGSARFKLANPWLAEVTALPYTVLFVRGEVVDGFAASKGSYLVERLATAAT